MIKPIGNRVLLEIEKIEKKTASGIILSTTTEDTYQNIATIVAIGKVEDNSLEIGTKVVFDTTKTTKVKNEDKEYLICNYEDILATLG